MGKYDKYKNDVLKYSQLIFKKGYNIGTGGNVSMLIEGEKLIAITPSSREYMSLNPDDICVVDFDSSLVEGQYRHSIETNAHLSVYKNRPDVNAVIHTHQTFASVFALIDEPIPALFDEVVMNIGDRIDIIPYGMSGSQELVDNIKAKLKNRCNCYILQNHGALSLGTTIEKAFRNAELLEKVTHVYHYAIATGRKLSTLPGQISDLLFQLLKSEQDNEIERKKAVLNGN
ncbi:MAG: class II aldolase/adducin family protein [Deltaproteobacteria bacterium]|nr:class II aldolase/adducin family protein [Deltaproteobacteria bacterium]MCL5792999.1 class II aldolase/adducin family protein [Deltaproteobacteria bacterium]